MADVVDSPTTAATEPPAGVSPVETPPATEATSAGAPESPAAPAEPTEPAAETPSAEIAVPAGYVPGAKFNGVRKELKRVTSERDQMASRMRELEQRATANEDLVREATTMRDLRAVLAENPELEAMVLAQLQTDPKPRTAATPGKNGVPVARLDPEIEKSLKTVADGVAEDRKRREMAERQRDQQGRIDRITGSINAWCKAHGYEAEEKINPRNPEYTRFEQVLDHLLASAHRHNNGTLDEEDIPEYLEDLAATIGHQQKSARVGYAKHKADITRGAAAAPPPTATPITPQAEKPPSIRDTKRFNDYISRAFGGGGASAA